ncbi:helix-turn-helix domain-containing protein [Blastomonas sp.]|uniref:MmyB family transcriptional regulator n=1 Tax=Blastomonas sp. TaxID=1909299 RepID=UPI003593D114
MTQHPRQAAPVGSQLRQWRERRRLSQLQLALEVEMSTRHLSFVETGRAQPSRDLIMRLADYLDIPLRARNQILLAAGLAPEFEETGLSAPEMAEAMAVIEHLLAAHAPFPAMVVDRHWNMVASNAAVAVLTEQIAAHLLVPPVNVLRLALHPDGLAPQVVNYELWRSYILHRLDRDIDLSADEGLAALRDELAGYPGVANDNASPGPPPIALPLVIDTAAGRLSFIGTVTTFGTPRDITLSELALETFFPADSHTAQVLRTLAET